MPFVQLPNLRLHYEHNGQGDTVLLLVHGNFASWRWWQPLLTQLPANYYAYAPEMRGFGDSEKPFNGYHIEQLAADLLAFIDVMQLPKLHLVGHSLGGAVSLQMALEHPELFHSLTLVCPAPAEGMPQLQRHQVSGMAKLLPHFSNFAELHQLLNSLDMTRNVIKRSLQSMLPHFDPRDQQFAVLLDDAVRLPPQAITGFIDSLSQWDVMAQLPQLTKPVLVIAGKQDPIIDLATLERMVQALPHAQLLVWDNTGHGIPLEQPSALQTTLVKFITGQQIEPSTMTAQTSPIATEPVPNWLTWLQQQFGRDK